MGVAAGRVGASARYTRPMSFDPMVKLRERFAGAIARAFPGVEGDPAIAPSRQAALGDFQSNAAMAIAKRVGKNPREVAKAIVSCLDLGDLAERIDESSIAGPGFINIRLRGEALSRALSAMDGPDLGVARAGAPQTIVVDLLGVNLAKQMHVGHLRSPIIGDAIARTLERQGHRVIRQNHVGDWGLNIAMVVSRVMDLEAAGKLRLKDLTLDDLDAHYKAAQAACQRDAKGLDAVRRLGLGPKAEAELSAQVEGAEAAFARAKETLVRLQAKEPATYAAWLAIAEITMSACLAAARRLHVNVTADHSAGESSYADELKPMVDELLSRGIAEHDQGAVIVRVEGAIAGPEGTAYGGIKEPCLIRKSDGGYLYATTDVAAIRRRVQKLGADRLVYVIDARQNLHLRQVFAAAARAGYATCPRTGKVALMEHAAFGAVLGEDGRPFKTRTGESVNLRSLIDEAVERAYAAVKARAGEDAPASDQDLRARAEAIGVAAMKYADLCNDRVKDYGFSFDRMLAFEGNTGPYLLYALVRTKSIFRKAADRGVSFDPARASFAVREPAEKNLALALLRYASALEGVAGALEPHRLCSYVYELAGAFSAFFDQCPVLAAPDEPTRQSRLKLCDLTARVLGDGLGVLGLPTVERM